MTEPPDYYHAMFNAFLLIAQEMPRAFREHPPEEWAAMTPRNMFFKVQA